MELVYRLDFEHNFDSIFLYQFIKFESCHWMKKKLFPLESATWAHQTFQSALIKIKMWSIQDC